MSLIPTSTDNILDQIKQIFRSKVSDVPETPPGVTLKRDTYIKRIGYVKSFISILSMLENSVAFNSFIYEEACQLEKAVIKALIRCREWEEAGRRLNEYERTTLTNAFSYQTTIGPLNPITHTSFYEYFLREWEDNRKLEQKIQSKSPSYSPVGLKPPWNRQEWLLYKMETAEMRRSIIRTLLQTED